MKTLINPDCIISVEIHEKDKSPWYKYKNAHRRFFFWNRPEGIYFRNSAYISIEELKQFDNLYLEDEVVYINPYIKIYYGNTYIGKYFNTLKELDEYIETLHINIRLIKVK